MTLQMARVAYHFSVWVCYPNSKGMLWEQQRVSLLSLLWEYLTKAWICHSFCLCCHPQEKWPCCISPWQLCVLKRHTTCSQSLFFVSLLYSILQKKVPWNHICGSLLKVVKPKWGWLEIQKQIDDPKFRGEPQSNLCPGSEPKGILLVWRVEALLHSLRMWTWTYELTCINMGFMYKELLCVEAHGEVWGDNSTGLDLPCRIWPFFECQSNSEKT